MTSARDFARGVNPHHPEAFSKLYQPTTGARCTCKRDVERDNCPACEGTGMVIDFAAIRARSPNGK